ncbi:methyl-accepting chemotaxis protein [Candidatus Magnetomorum sp. HK-1]|nr:methyl-accepting chemotaxis protein [Candidatus Magnetomorum sp. HK-1]
MWFKKLTLRSKVLIGGLSPLVFLLFTGIMSIMSIDSIIETNNRVEFSHDVMEKTTQVFGSAVDMETGMRGYLLAGKSEFLEPYIEGEKIAYEKILSLQKDVSHHTEQVKRLEEMKNKLKTWQKDIAEPAIALRKQVGDSKTMDDIANFVGEAREMEYFDAFRKLVDEFNNEEKNLMKIREESSKKIVYKTDQTIILCIIVSVFLGIILSLTITKSVLNQLGCDPSMLASTAKKIAKGDMSERLSTSDDESVAKCLDQVADVLENVLNEFNSVVNNIGEGKLTHRGDATKFHGSYKNLIIGANNIADVLMGIVNSVVIPIFVISKDYDIIFMNSEASRFLGASQNEILNQKCYDIFKTKDCRTSNCACSQAMNTGQRVSRETSAQIFNKSFEIDYYGLPLKSADGSVVGAFEFIIDQTGIRRSKKYQEIEVDKLSSVLHKVAEGDMSLRYTPSNEKDVSEVVYNNFNNISKALNSTISKIEKINDYQMVEVDSLSDMLQKIANGDMNQIYVPAKADDDTIDVHKNFSNISSAINTTVQKIAKISSYQEKEVSSLTAMLDMVSKGDITQQYKVIAADDDTLEAHNNFQTIADALNSTLADLSQIIRTVKDYAETVATSSEELSTISMSLSESTEQMSTKTTSVAAAVEQMSSNITSMASSTEEISVSANEVSSTTGQMSENMNSVAAAVEESSMSINEIGKAAREGSQISINATTMANDATNVMNTLGEAAKEIGEVTEVIKRIADQTNLLALNATIEAASAGDAGRGFAVVANEIKKLANQSAQAAENISKRIKGVQSNTIDAIKSIDQVTGVIKKINESVTLISSSVDDQTGVTNEIATNVSQATNGVKQVSLLIEEVAKGLVDMSKNSSEVAYGTNEVSSNVQLVDRSVSENSNNIKQVSTSANNLAEIASQLRELVSTFNV